jgi:hypothetical protein
VDAQQQSRAVVNADPLAHHCAKRLSTLVAHRHAAARALWVGRGIEERCSGINQA